MLPDQRDLLGVARVLGDDGLLASRGRRAEDVGGPALVERHDLGTARFHLGLPGRHRRSQPPELQPATASAATTMTATEHFGSDDLCVRHQWLNFTTGRIRASHFGRYQFRSPSSAIDAGTSRIRTTVASSSTATASVRPSSVGGIGPVTPNAMNTTIMTSAAFVIGSTGAGDAFTDRPVGVAGGLVAFADRGEQEQLVVHREPEQQREEEQRRPRVDEPLVLDAEQAGADPVLEHERGEPERGADGDEVHEDRRDGDDEAAEHQQEEHEREDRGSPRSRAVPGR